MPWKAGESGNPGGRLKEKQFLAALQRAIAADDGVQLRKAAEQLLKCAANGEGWAIKELADRLDGKAHQSVDMSNPDGTPLFSAIERVIIEPKQ